MVEVGQGEMEAELPVSFVGCVAMQVLLVLRGDVSCQGVSVVGVDEDDAVVDAGLFQSFVVFWIDAFDCFISCCADVAMDEYQLGRSTPDGLKDELPIGNQFSCLLNCYLHQLLKFTVLAFPQYMLLICDLKSSKASFLSVVLTRLEVVQKYAGMTTLYHPIPVTARLQTQMVKRVISRSHQSPCIKAPFCSEASIIDYHNVLFVSRPSDRIKYVLQRQLPFLILLFQIVNPLLPWQLKRWSARDVCRAEDAAARVVDHKPLAFVV